MNINIKQQPPINTTYQLLSCKARYRMKWSEIKSFIKQMTSLLLKDRTKLIVTLLQWTRSGISYLSVNKNWYTCTVFVLISLLIEHLRDNYYLNVTIVHLYELMTYNCIYSHNILVKVMEKCWVYAMLINKLLPTLCRDTTDINFILQGQLNSLFVGWVFKPKSGIGRLIIKTEVHWCSKVLSLNL